MRIVRGLARMQRMAGLARQGSQRIGLVPTMGSLHAGHIRLVHRARRMIGGKGLLVVSIYVNPTQFGPKEDFSKYPRDLAGDSKLCREAGVDVLFVPGDTEMYPAAEGDRFSTYVVETQLSEGMEGASRPTHFRGVTTIVAKLFNLVQPDVAVFGQKDFQQAAVVRRMVRDLNFPLQLVVAPTMRETDGLAMSSRNRYLSPEERAQAPVLYQAMGLAKKLVRQNRRGIGAGELRSRMQEFIGLQPSARIDYISFFHPATLEPVQTVHAGTQVALAVFIGRTRLIDNAKL